MEVKRELTGRETEPWEIIYFKLYQSQLPLVDRAIETAVLMLGSDKSRGYCASQVSNRIAAVDDSQIGQSLPRSRGKPLPSQMRLIK